MINLTVTFTSSGTVIGKKTYTLLKTLTVNGSAQPWSILIRFITDEIIVIENKMCV